jgi:serine/threonine protein kinase
MTDTRVPAVVQPASLIGSVLGNYRLTAEISSGGMGTVYRAEHELLGRTAAVKLLRPELTANEELVERFFNEARAATAIRHPGIVEVFDFGYTSAGRAYLVMELLEGRPLGKAIAGGRFSELEAAVIVRGVASALRAAHAQGIIHRDLKPDNIFLVPDADTGTERPTVLDFGIAKLSTVDSVRQTQTGVLMGTPMYMAPEQARAASQIDQRADLYSLGCILYEMLVGTPPYESDGAGEILAMHLFAEVPHPKERIPALSPEIDAIVVKLLAKEPGDRFADASALIAALTSITGRLSGELAALSISGPRQVVIHMPSTLRPAEIPTEAALPKRSMRMPLIAGALTIAIAIAAVIAISVMSRGSTAEPEAIAEPVKPAPPAPIAPAPAPKPPAPPPVESAPVVTQQTPKPRPAPQVKKLKTTKGSPIEVDLGGPKTKDTK